MKWSQDMSFDENIESIKQVIKADFTITDKEVEELLQLVDKITPELVSEHASITLKIKSKSVLQPKQDLIGLLQVYHH